MLCVRARARVRELSNRMQGNVPPPSLISAPTHTPSIAVHFGLWKAFGAYAGVEKDMRHLVEVTMMGVYVSVAVMMMMVMVVVAAAVAVW